MEQFAVMNIEKGEEIAIAVVSGHIPGTGRYKFLAKKKRTENMNGLILKKGITGTKKLCTGEK